MYYVDLKRIEERSKFLDQLIAWTEELRGSWKDASPIYSLAEERILHLMIECVTDIGSDLIDGFMMRDAGSYEDIISILLDEQVVDQALANTLTELIRLRKTLVQDYVEWKRGAEHPLLAELPSQLKQFTAAVDHFLKNQPIPIE